MDLLEEAPSNTFSDLNLVRITFCQEHAHDIHESTCAHLARLAAGTFGSPLASIKFPRGQSGAMRPVSLHSKGGRASKS